MKIIVISFIYVPEVNPRAFRWSSVIEYWVKQGHSVDLICHWKPSLPRQEILNGVNIYRTGSGISELQAYIKKFLVSQPSSLLKTDNVKSLATKTTKQWLLVAGNFFYNSTWVKIRWPDYACLWYFSALKQAKELNKFHYYDGLVTVSHPFTSHLVGMSLKNRFPYLKWIVDVGDPFCFAEETPLNNQKLYKGLNYTIEKNIFQLCDAVTVTTEPTLEIYSSLFPESAEKIFVIPPLVTKWSKHNVMKKPILIKDKIKMVFVGTLYRKIRTPDFILWLFNHLLQTHLQDRLEIHFYGNWEDCRESFNPYQKWIESHILIHGMVSYADANEAINNADILINIGNKTPYQLPSKIVEYAVTGKPILNLVEIENDSSAIFLKNYPAQLVLCKQHHNSVSYLIEKTLNFIENLPDPVDPIIIQNILSSCQVDSVATAYEKLLKNG